MGLIRTIPEAPPCGNVAVTAPLHAVSESEPVQSGLRESSAQVGNVLKLSSAKQTRSQIPALPFLARGGNPSVARQLPHSIPQLVQLSLHFQLLGSLFYGMRI